MAGNATLRKIVKLLEGESVEESIAAAVVLGAMAPRDASVVAGLGRTVLRSDNLPLALASARALGAIGNAGALKALLPLLQTKGELRETGAIAIAGCGASALPALRRALPETDLRSRDVIYRILARLRTAPALELLLEAFLDPNFEAVKMAGRALRGEASGMADAERKKTATAVMAFLRTKRVQENRAAVNSCLLVLGSLARREAVPVLLRHSGPDQTRATRRHALASLRHILNQQKDVPDPVRDTLFPYLDEADFEAVVEPSLAILERADIPGRLDRELERHLGSRFAQVRQFAVRRLARSRTRRGQEALLKILDGENPELRRSGEHALRHSPRGASILLPRLLAEKDADRSWELVHLIKPQAGALTAAERKKLAATAARRLDAGDRRAESLLHLFRHADSSGFFKTFHNRAITAKRARRYADAERDLRLISRSAHFDEDARFLLALMTLTGGNRKTLTPESPRARQALRDLRTLAGEGFDLEARLRKESRVLGPEGLYAVGFGLTERRGPLQPLGQKLLKSLVRSGPRTRLGRMARAKLETEGLA